MSPSLKNLIDSTFFLTYNAGIQPSEVDMLTTHEMREYVNLTRDRKKAESENSQGLFGSLAKLLGLRKR